MSILLYFRTLLHDSNFLKKLLCRNYASYFIVMLKQLILNMWRNQNIDFKPIIEKFLASSHDPPKENSSIEVCLQKLMDFLIKEGMDVEYNIPTFLMYSCKVCESISDGQRTNHLFLAISTKTVQEGLKKFSKTVCDSRRQCIECKNSTLHAGSISYSWKDCNVLVIYVPETVNQNSFEVTSSIIGNEVTSSTELKRVPIDCGDTYNLFSVVYNQNRKVNRYGKIYSVASRYSHDTSHSAWNHYPDGVIKDDDIVRYSSNKGARLLFYQRNQENTTNMFVKFNEQEAFIAKMRSVSKVNYRNIISS